MSTFHPNGQMLAGLGADDKGYGAVSLYNPTGKERVSLLIDNDRGGFRAFNAKDVTIVELLGNMHGGACHLHNNAGKKVVLLETEASQGGAVHTANSTGDLLPLPAK